MDNTTNGCLAASALAYLRKSGFTNVGIDCDSQEIDRQSDCIVEWAGTEGAILDPHCCDELDKYEFTTAEHEVFRRGADNRAVKITYAGCFGITPEPKGTQKAATPFFYLRRMELMNDYFCSGIRLEGVMMRRSLLIGASGDQPSFVISQPWWTAADERAPHPSESEVADFMREAGYSEKPKSYFGWETAEITVIDARIDNFIKTVEGVVPIDLVICENSPSGGDLVQRAVGVSR